MAHYAELDQNNIVVRVVVISNDDIKVAGVESEDKGKELCSKLFKKEKWVQTSYSASKRGRFAAIGDTYDETLDAFIAPRPFESWTLDKKILSWVAPKSKPETIFPCYWNEKTMEWVIAQK